MIGLYKKIDGEVAFRAFSAEDAEAALKDGWKDNPSDAEAKRGRKKKSDADEA